MAGLSATLQALTTPDPKERPMTEQDEETFCGAYGSALLVLLTLVATLAVVLARFATLAGQEPPKAPIPWGVQGLTAHVAVQDGTVYCVADGQPSDERLRAACQHERAVTISSPYVAQAFAHVPVQTDLERSWLAVPMPADLTPVAPAVA